MNFNIVHVSEPIVLVGGGKARKTGLMATKPLANRVIAADGGADWLLARGIMPEAVIGDMDSLSDAAHIQLGEARLIRVEEQDSTDFAKCLERIEAPLILGVGFLGGRTDHELAAYHALLAHPEKRCILIGAEDIICLLPRKLELDLPIGSRLSLFPLGEMRARSQGLRWQIDDVRFAPGRRIGTSNEVVGPVRLEALSDEMLLILPRAALPALAASLQR